MALKNDFYRALEDLLGPENVSRDPVITESYSFPIRAAATRKGEYLPRFEAVTLPKDTAEVQALIKLCNRCKVQFKASSTGWLYCDPTGPGCIKLDLLNPLLGLVEDLPTMGGQVHGLLVPGERFLDADRARLHRLDNSVEPLHGLLEGQTFGGLAHAGMMPATG